MISPADSISTPAELQQETVDRIMDRFDAALGGKLMRLFTTRKRVAELCAANRETLAHVVDKRALFLLLMCIDHTLRAICCGSIRHAQGRMQECDSQEFAECVVESNPLYAFLLRMLLEGNVHNRPGDGCGLSRSMYEFVKAEIEYCQQLCEEDSMRPAQSYTFHPALEAETVKELTELSESSTEMSVARQFGQVYTSRLKKSTGSLYEIPRDVLLKMEFVKRQDPLRAEAIVLCAYVLNAGRDFRALLGTSHATGMRALARETCPGLAGPGLHDLFQVAIGNTDVDVIAARQELNSHGCTWAWPGELSKRKTCIFIPDRQRIEACAVLTRALL